MNSVTDGGDSLLDLIMHWIEYPPSLGTIALLKMPYLLPWCEAHKCFAQRELAVETSPHHLVHAHYRHHTRAGCERSEHQDVKAALAQGLFSRWFVGSFTLACRVPLLRQELRLTSIQISLQYLTSFASRRFSLNVLAILNVLNGVACPEGEARELTKLGPECDSGPSFHLKFLLLLFYFSSFLLFYFSSFLLFEFFTFRVFLLYFFTF